MRLSRALGSHSEALGAKVERLSAPAGQAVPVKALEQKLEADKERNSKR